MELKRDLLKISKKSLFRIILGIGFPVIAITWIVVRKIEYDDIRPFDWLYFGLFVFSGIIHIFEGFGYSFSKLFGNAFILIDQDVIRIKTGVLEKEQRILWDEIASIDYKPTFFQITKIDKTTINLKLSDLDYSLIQEIKEIIRHIGKEKDSLVSY